MKLPLVSGTDMIKILSARGFHVIRQRSSHVQMKDDQGRLITVPVHAGKAVGIGVCSRFFAMPKSRERNL